jgi:hypothetical protein
MMASGGAVASSMHHSERSKIRGKTAASQKEMEEVEAAIGADLPMIPIWKEQLRMYSGRTPLKQWLLEIVGMQTRLLIPRLAKRHLDLLVKWVRDNIPRFKSILSCPHDPADGDELEDFEPIPMALMISLQNGRIADHEAQNPIVISPDDPFAGASEFLDEGVDPEAWSLK